jgi:hypothetical protein
MHQLKAEIRSRASLSQVEVEAMYNLYELYFESTTSEIFAEDLAEKDYVVVLLGEHASIEGFSTLAVFESEFKGRPIRALFSGDTIISSPYWGTFALPEAFSRLAGQIKAERPDEPLYWLLISKGYRTYRYLPLFSKAYYPSWQTATPPDIQELIGFLGRLKFGGAYDAVSGLVRFPQSRGQLRGSWADIKAEALSKPEVAFFLDRNPNYRNGDELVCITELVEENLRSLALRSFRQGARAKVAVP